MTSGSNVQDALVAVLVFQNLPEHLDIGDGRAEFRNAVLVGVYSRNDVEAAIEIVRRVCLSR